MVNLFHLPGVAGGSPVTLPVLLINKALHQYPVNLDSLLRVLLFNAIRYQGLSFLIL